MRKTILNLILVYGVLGAAAQQVNVYTIPNQSAHFDRMPSRESSTEIDAVFSNPAGLTHMDDGFHFSINNQVALQDYYITSDYEHLNEVPSTYKGEIRAYFFPGVFLAWKRKRLVVSGGAMLAGGGGGASFNNLPSADMGIADIGPALKISLLDGLNKQLTTNTGVDHGYNEITGYDFDFHSRGVAYYPGYQLGLSYLINNYLSVAIATRFINGTVRSDGHVKDIQINVPQHGGYQSPVDYLVYLSNQPEMNSIQQGLLSATATFYEELSQDRIIEVAQRGNGYTPIISLHATPSNKLDVAVKYEHKTVVKLKTKVYNDNDGGGVFTDGEVVRSDMPGFVSFGTKYKWTPKLLTALGSRVFFEKSANYNGREKLINKNYFEVSSAVEYAVTKKIKVSGGYTFNKANVDKDYQNEADSRLPGHTVAFGGAYEFNDDITMNLGVLLTKFVNRSYTYEHIFAEGIIEADPIPYNRSHEKNVLIFALGVDFSLNNGE